MISNYYIKYMNQLVDAFNVEVVRGKISFFTCERLLQLRVKQCDVTVAINIFFTLH